MAWPLTWHQGARAKTDTTVKNSKKPLFFCLYSSEAIVPLVHFPRFFYFRFSQFKILLTAIFYFLLFSTAVLGQDVTSSDEDDPYIDPDGASVVLLPTKRVESQRAYMFGISYGLNPIIILAPALSFSMYWDPIIIGMEISDSDHLGIWEKERKENFGTSRFRGDTQLIKWFYGENFYLLAAREHRTIDLWNRTYNRISGKALFDMHFDTTVASLGAGLLRFNDIGFLAIDIIRFNIQQKQSVKVVEYWETWSINPLGSGTRESLDNNIQDRTDKWFDIINSPSGFIITFGIYF
ncbi:MAG TPA: hypothetical protein DC040_06715 [Deltaproteobacteria bacterium]|nr:hypothetical protein [Deltaproteobacteria bacterium]